MRFSLATTYPEAGSTRSILRRGSISRPTSQREGEAYRGRQYLGTAVWPGRRQQRERRTQPTLLYRGPKRLCKRPVWSDHGWALERCNSSRASRRVFEQAAGNKLPLTLAGSERRHCSPLDCRNQLQVEGQHRIQHISKEGASITSQGVFQDPALVL